MYMDESCQAHVRYGTAYYGDRTPVLPSFACLSFANSFPRRTPTILTSMTSAFSLLTAGGARFDKTKCKHDIELFQVSPCHRCTLVSYVEESKAQASVYQHQASSG